MCNMLMTGWEVNVSRLAIVVGMIVVVLVVLLIYLIRNFNPEKYRATTYADSPCLIKMPIGRDNFRVEYSIVTRPNRALTVDGAVKRGIPPRFISQNNRLGYYVEKITDTINEKKITELYSSRDSLQANLDIFATNLGRVYQISIDRQDKVLSETEYNILLQRLYNENDSIIDRVRDLYKATEAYI